MTDDAPIERSLHATSWLFTLWVELRRLALPAIALIVAARFTFFDLFWMLFVIPIAIVAVVRQFSLRYTLRDREMIVHRSLVIYRRERHIPYARIHNLRVSETPLHRLLHVVEVAIETASGKEPEATLRVVSREAYEELRAHVAARSEALAATTVAAGASTGTAGAVGSADAAAAGSPSAGASAAGATPPLREVVVTLSLRDALTYGALDNRGFVIAGAIAGFIWETVSSYQGDRLWDWRVWMAPWRMASGGWRWLLDSAFLQSAIGFVALVVAALVLLKLFSILWAFATLYDFRVERTRDHLSVTHGLITRASTVIPLHRIQQIKVREKPLHRLAGRVEIEVDTVGSTRDQGRRQPVWLAPLAARTAVPRLLDRAGAPVAPDAVDWRSVHPRAAHRVRLKALRLLVLLTAGLWAVGAPPLLLGTAAALLAPCLLIAATLHARHLGYAVAPPCLLIRRGWLWRTVHITWIDRVQALAVAASPFDRRHGMATLIVDTAAGGAMGSGLRVPYLAADTARALQQRLAADVAATQFQW